METAINFITQHYNYFLMFVSAVVAALIQDIVKDVSKPDLKRQNMDLGRKILTFLWNMAIYPAAYALLCASSVFVYAIIRSRKTGGAWSLIFANMYVYYFLKNMFEFVLIPAIVSIFTYLIGKNNIKSILTFLK